MRRNLARLACWMLATWLLAWPAQCTTAEAESVELFGAMDRGWVSARLIQKDESQARLVVRNNTDRPLDVRLPEVFAGLPLAQVRGVGAQPGLVGPAQGNAGSQTTGGGIGANGTNLFNIPAEKVRQLKVATVCLEHGKRTPRPGMPYQIGPIESVSDEPALRAVLAALGQGYIGQRAAQAAAWHLANRMSWAQLADKSIERLDGTRENFFDRRDLEQAMRLVEYAPSSTQTAARQFDATLSPGLSCHDELPAIPPAGRRAIGAAPVRALSAEP